MVRSLGVEERAHRLLQAMRQDEKLALIFGYYSSDAPWKNFTKPAGGLPQAAGFVPGNARLGIPALYETDAGIGVASQPGPNARRRTALPSNLATAATWNPEIAYAGGRMIGGEARSSGFNVMLAGGIDLARDPRNGRNFEYGGEDPWLAASMVAAQIRGIQSNHLISTIKHFAFNDQETKRTTLDARIDDRSARMSDLLAFQWAIEQSNPGAVMCAYNRVNGVYSCENAWLLNEVLKADWRYRGFVMSDWGAVHSTARAANAGLDQESGYPFDASPYFSDALREAVEDGDVPQARIDDMVLRILRAMFANGLFDDPAVLGDIDYAAHAEISRADAEESMVLLKNIDGVLPLRPGLKSIAVIGSHADVGVLSGAGSSQVYADGVLVVPSGDAGRGAAIYFPSSPLRALATRTTARVAYDDGANPAAAVRLAARSDVVIVFAHQWSGEGWDLEMRLDDEQDALIAAVAKANPRVIVVLETGSAVLMPWIDHVAAVLEAWYPGTSGGEAIARVLTGEVDPSGRLPLTFPRSVAELPRREVDGGLHDARARIAVDYTIEGAAVGYKWFDREKLKTLFPFGFGLSFGRFDLSGFNASVDENRVSLHFTLTNTGTRFGKVVAQVYVSPGAGVDAGWEAPKRLCGFAKAALQPGEGRTITLSVDARLLATYDDAGHEWVIAPGEYGFLLSRNADAPVASVRLHLARERFGRRPDAGH